jgi:ATP-dependent RNA helicase DeaD
LLALVCRRGGIRGGDVGAIRIDRYHSTVEVAATVADGFARAASEPDPRDPRVTIRVDDGAPPARPGPPERAHRPHTRESGGHRPLKKRAPR